MSYRTASVSERCLAMRYFVTFACYGAHIHGEGLGSVDRNHNQPGGQFLEIDPLRAGIESRQMNQPPFELDVTSREIVLQALVGVCSYRGWKLLAAHVRSNHVHVIAEAEVPPEKMMSDFKAYATRALNQFDGEATRKRWARHGSTRWLWTDQSVRDAIRYVVDEQGEAMALFVGADV